MAREELKQEGEEVGVDGMERKWHTVVYINDDGSERDVKEELMTKTGTKNKRAQTGDDIGRSFSKKQKARSEE